MSQDKPDSREVYGYNPQHELLYDPLLEDIVINKSQLQIILEGIEQAKLRPKAEDAFPWFGVFLAFALPQVNSEFKDFVFKAAVWQALDAMAAAFFLFKTGQISWIIFKSHKQVYKTPAQTVQELYDRTRRRLEEYRNQKLAQISIPPSLPPLPGPPPDTTDYPTSTT